MYIIVGREQRRGEEEGGRTEKPILIIRSPDLEEVI
jgi:hypothetical protein